MRRALLLVLLGVACGDDPAGDEGGECEGVDCLEVTCDPSWVVPECVAAAVENLPATSGATHIPLPEPIVYAQRPPASGPHRAEWARWGEYDVLPPQRWVHNLEHGGVAILYHPCADPELVESLRAYAKARPEDAGGPFRWVLTPYPDLEQAFVVVAWEWRLSASCFDAGELDAFLAEHYNDAPENVPGNGDFDDGWLGR